MLAIASLLVILTMSLVITRVATTALTHTGLSRETGRWRSTGKKVIKWILSMESINARRILTAHSP